MAGTAVGPSAERRRRCRCSSSSSTHGAKSPARSTTAQPSKTSTTQRATCLALLLPSSAPPVLGTPNTGCASWAASLRTVPSPIGAPDPRVVKTRAAARPSAPERCWAAPPSGEGGRLVAALRPRIRSPRRDLRHRRGRPIDLRRRRPRPPLDIVQEVLARIRWSTVRGRATTPTRQAGVWGVEYHGRLCLK